MSTVAKDELKEMIFATLVEPPGQLDREIIEKCKGLIVLDASTRTVRLAHVRLTEKEKIALYCLGKRLLAYALDEPSLADVIRDELQDKLGIDAKKVSAYATLLIERERLLERGARGTYRAKVHGMLPFIEKSRQKAGLP